MFENTRMRRLLFKIPNVRVVDPVLARRKSDAHGSHHNTVPDFNVSEIWIADQMRELMKRKPLSKIRITEICRAAEIERSTFYYHFKDKYDLIAWIFCHSAENTDVTDLQAAANHIQQMKNDILFYKRAYEDTSQNALWQYMLEYFVDAYTSQAKKILHTDTLDPQLSFRIRLYCYGAVSMSKEWILQDTVTSAETVIKMMFASMAQTLQEVYFSGQ